MRSVKDILSSQGIASKALDLKSSQTIALSNIISDNHERDVPPPSSSETYKCTTCQDRGIFLEGDIAYPCDCMKTRKRENQFRHARISRELMNCRFERFRFDYYIAETEDPVHREGAKRAFDASKLFVEECLRNPHGLGIMFTGPVGSGKTFLAAAIANKLIESKFHVLFLIVPDLLDELRATFKSEINELDLLDSARTIPILILDDLGAHNYTDWTRNRLYSIINYRINEQLPTVITSNLSLDEMEDYIGVRTTSRIIQSSRIFRLTVPNDIRHQIYQEREKKNK